MQDGRILVDLFYETYAESVINGAINVNVYVVGLSLIHIWYFAPSAG